MFSLTVMLEGLIQSAESGDPIAERTLRNLLHDGVERMTLENVIDVLRQADEKRQSQSDSIFIE